jgi:glycine/D-amino acid oxidase-like deaminating enzyme
VNSDIDYIVIGQGLAGSCLALQLIRRNRTVVVFDEPQHNHSTSVAAGLFNPITGKMLAKTWQAERLFPYFYSFYREAEVRLKEKFFFPMPVYRPFGSVEEQNEWMGRSNHASMMEYIETIYLSPAFSDEVHDPVGGVLLRHGGYVDTPVFIEAVRALLKQMDAYREEKFEEAELREPGRGVSYQQFTAKKIIYCRGVDDLNTGCFSWLPIKPLKGETLLITMPPVNRIYNRGVYVVPGSTAGTYNAGATYDFDITPETTARGRAELEARLNELVRFPYEIISQNWGIRPTTPDRRLLLGPHPIYGNRVIFNGLGTKGVSLAPYFSGQLAAWLEGEGEITPEVHIGRFKSLYSKFE